MANPEIGAINQGMSMGKTALSGLRPSAQNPRGGQPAADPLSNDFQRCLACLNDLAVKLNRSDLQGSQKEGNEVSEFAVKLQRISIDRQDAMLKQAQQAMTGGGNNFPNVNAQGVM